MGMPAAKQGDQVMATDMHMIQPPGTAPPVLTPHPFAGLIDGGLSSDVKIMGPQEEKVHTDRGCSQCHRCEGDQRVPTRGQRVRRSRGCN